MSETNNGAGPAGRVRSLSELPQAIAPPRDLWAAIEAQLPGTGPLAAQDAQRSEGGGSQQTRRSRFGAWRIGAVAAAVGAVAVGIWMARPQSSTPRIAADRPAARTSVVLTAATRVSDPRYIQQRDELLRALPARLAALPPESQTKVKESLLAIRQAMKDLESALGKDSSNALLQELLINTYQDEMRVLTTVHEASAAGKGI